MPKKPEGKIKKKFLQIRVTDEQRDQIKEKARAMETTVTDLILESLDRTKIRRPQGKPAPELVALEQKKIYEIAKIGNNLNQLARWANTYKDGADAVQVIQTLVSIEHELKAVLYAH